MKKPRCSGRIGREAFVGEHELALGMTRYVLDRVVRDSARSA